MCVLVVGNFVFGSFFCIVFIYLWFSFEIGVVDVKVVVVQYVVYSQGILRMIVIGCVYMFDRLLVCMVFL